MTKQKVFYHDLGKISYKDAWEYQSTIQKKLIDHKLDRRRMPPSQLASYQQIHYLLMCEHNHVYTLGKSGTVDNLLLNQEGLDANEIEYFKINRGGDITYHGPGQITGYPIFDLDEFFTDVHKYVRYVEEVVIRVLKGYGIEGERLEGYTGVWIKEPKNNRPLRKICAIGVHLSRWVTMHGFALNVNTELSYYDNIIPCGITDKNKSVTSIQNEIGRKIDMEEVKMSIKSNFASLFEYEYVNTKSLII